MHTFIKQFALVWLLAQTGSSITHAAPPGTPVNAVGLVQGGSEAAFTWRVPDASTYKYKVWVQIPQDGTATNAPYRVYAKGNPQASDVCSPTDTLVPCFEIAVNQAANQAQWVQLTLDGDSNTAWKFTQNGFVALDAGNISAGEKLGVAAASFEAIGFNIGMKYGGGRIFYLDETGQHGLIAALTDQSTGIQWSNGLYIKTGAKATAVGTGQANTHKIVLRQGAGNYAAQLCDDLVIGKYNDWFLPSKDELNLMYKNIGPGAAKPLTNIGGFKPHNNYNLHNYWSSSENTGHYAWSQGFGSGLFGGGFQYNWFKVNTFYVRAARAF